MSSKRPVAWAIVDTRFPDEKVQRLYSSESSAKGAKTQLDNQPRYNWLDHKCVRAEREASTLVVKALYFGETK